MSMSRLITEGKVASYSGHFLWLVGVSSRRVALSLTFDGSDVCTVWLPELVGTLFPLVDGTPPPGGCSTVTVSWNCAGICFSCTGRAEIGDANLSQPLTEFVRRNWFWFVYD